MGKTERVVFPDLLKYLCCFLVVFIHTDVPALMDTIFLPITRVAVPLFFMISGYFYRSVSDRGREGRQISKVCGLVLAGNILHIGWSVFKIILRGQSVGDFFIEDFGGEALVKLLIFNVPKYMDSLWYLFALLYTLIVVYILKRLLREKWDKIYILIPLLLTVNLVLGAYSGIIFGKVLPLYLSRNFLFCGLPYFLLGDFISSGKCKTVIGSGAGVLIFLAATVGESLLCNRFAVNEGTDNYITTAFLAVALFIWFFGKEDNIASSSLLTKVSVLGQYSFVIYIIHPIILEFWMRVCKVVGTKLGGFSDVFGCVGPLVVLIAATVVALVWDRMKKLVLRKQ